MNARAMEVYKRVRRCGHDLAFSFHLLFSEIIRMGSGGRGGCCLQNQQVVTTISKALISSFLGSDLKSANVMIFSDCSCTGKK